MTTAKYVRNDIGSILAHLVEEAGEVLAALGKTQRWGLDSYNPELPPNEWETNRKWLAREIGDLEGVIARYRSHVGYDRPVWPPQEYDTDEILSIAVDHIGRLVSAVGHAQRWGIAHYTPSVEIELLEPILVAVKSL